MKNKKYSSWGIPNVGDQAVYRLNWRNQPLPTLEKKQSILPYGKGRSYGDSCLNEKGRLIDTQSLNHFISFDEKTQVLRCESGVTLADILDRFANSGWFLPVTPGTKFVTVGGAIANDVHGKNHHRRGSFGNHVLRFALLRSDGETYICSRSEHVDLFKATIGGLGLTGLILWAEIILMPVDSNCIQVKTTKFNSLEDFFELSKSAEWESEYTVAWLDCAAKKSKGSGVFMSGQHVPGRISDQENSESKSAFAWPFMFPISLVNNTVSRLFNSYYQLRHRQETTSQMMNYDQFFYPLDKVGGWNQVYGKNGFYQYQCVYPYDHGVATTEKLFAVMERADLASSLAVIKVFGDIPSKGLLSFPRPGVTLAMDFPDSGKDTLALFEKFDEIIMHVGGAVYPAKDRRMSASAFRQFFADIDQFKRHVDPQFSSDFWQRVMGENL